jgi:ferrous iron transport protein B
MGHACAIPAISATRILRDPKERLATLLVIPLLTCSARLPTYALLVSTFFGKWGALGKGAIFTALYLAGIAGALVASAVLRRFAIRGRSLPLVLEMPTYRLPLARVSWRHGLRTASQFVREVGTTIVVVSVILWGLLNVPAPWGSAGGPEEPAIERSVAAAIGKAVEPVTRPLGFDWRINVGLIGSFGAREVMVGTLGVIFGIEDTDEDTAPLGERLRSAKRPDGQPAYDPATAAALLAFFVLACQCMSTVAALRRETKTLRWPAFVLAYTYGAAFAAAWLTRAVVSLFGGNL